MTIPPALMQDGIVRQLNKVFLALKKRLDHGGDFRGKTQWSYHDGAPDPTNLPNEPISIWLMFINAARDEGDSTFNAEYFTATWVIEIVMQDTGTDPYGFSQQPGFQAIGDIIDVLTKEPADISLDDSIDFASDLSIDHGIGRASGGNRAIGDWLITIRTHLPIFNCRQPT